MHSSLESIFCHDCKLQSIYDISAIMNRNQTSLCRYSGRLEFVSKFEYVLDFKLRFELIEKVLMGLQVILNPVFGGIFFSLSWNRWFRSWTNLINKLVFISFHLSFYRMRPKLTHVRFTIRWHWTFVSPFVYMPGLLLIVKTMRTLISHMIGLSNEPQLHVYQKPDSREADYPHSITFCLKKG